MSTNVAFQLAQKLKQSPTKIAEEIKKAVKNTSITKITTAGGGFLNFWLSEDLLRQSAIDVNSATGVYGHNNSHQKQQFVVEYSDPNPFKGLHVGHLYTSVVGDAIANLLEASGAIVHRVNFGGDVGLHVAKALWGILAKLGGEKPQELSKITPQDQIAWVSEAYVAGAKAYKADDSAKIAIEKINQQIYAIHAAGDKQSALAQIYWTVREWSYRYFDAFYEQIGSGFEKYYPESATAPAGERTVKEQLKAGVFERSDGAIIFDGEKHGLHRRVFITSQGLPTYEAKDIGLALTKWADYHFDKSIIITGNDITEYMKVVLKAIEQFEPEIAKRTVHITHGMVKLAGTGKMSSRAGNVLPAEEVLEATGQANQAANPESDEQIALGAVKYAFLKSQIGGDIIFSPTESVSLHGNSGPYLQYTHARAHSVLRKAGANSGKIGTSPLNAPERTLLLQLGQFPEVVETAAASYEPHQVATYLYELAQQFNLFYQGTRIIGSEAEVFRLDLTQAVATVLKNGLSLLGIVAPNRM
ncbi:arginine--tRNA ligase [Candidatus Microgenomates bacterium]|nr:arginine--tRNA ligase [Candidatus Microgenomates bacterium]